MTDDDQVNQLIQQSVSRVRKHLLAVTETDLSKTDTKFVRCYKDNEGYLENEKVDSIISSRIPFGGAIRTAATNLMKSLNKNSVLMQYSSQEEASKKEMKDLDDLSDMLKSNCSSDSVSQDSESSQDLSLDL